MFFNIQVFLFFVVSRLLGFLSRTLGKGEGTSIPGYLVETKFPHLIKFFNKKYKKVIYISGTNGKTTTRAILVELLEKNNIKVVSNKGGANILRGLASTLFSDLSYNLKTKSDYLVLEVEEATLPKISKDISVDNLILLNIFRDQLDAYGEIDNTLDYFVNFAKNQLNLTIFINGDDAKLLEITDKLPNCNFVYCGVEDINKPNYEGSSARIINYDYKAQEITILENKIDFKIANPDTSVLKYSTSLAGVYNIYNLLFAIALANTLKLKNIEEITKNFLPVFGRGEKFMVSDSQIVLYLVKNPEGFNQVLQYVLKAYTNKNINLTFLVNDKIADSRDVSWLWDVEFEKYRLEFLKSDIKVENIYTGGSRSDDILLRLEYADFYSINQGNNLKAIDIVAKNLVSSSSVNLVFATYTAMLDFRKEMSKYTTISKITD